MTYADSDRSAAWRAYRCYRHGTRTLKAVYQILPRYGNALGKAFRSNYHGETEGLEKILNVVLDIIRHVYLYAKSCIFHSR